MKKSKKLFALALAILMSVSLFAGCGGSGTSEPSQAPSQAPSGGLDLQNYTADKPLVLKFAHYGTSDTHPSNIISNKMKEKVEAASGGAIVIDIYDNGQLGYDTATFEGVMNGTIDFSINNPFMMAYYKGFEPLQLIELHYMFESVDHCREFMHSEPYDDFCSYGADSNIKMLGIQYLGFRSIGTGSKPMYNVEDLKNVRLRMSTSDVFSALFEKYGAVPVVMAPDEFIPALQNGVVDGTDLPAAIQLSANYTQYYKFYSETNHWAQWNFLCTDLTKWDNYSDDIRNIISTAANEAIDESFELNEQLNEEALADMEKLGIEVTYYEDLDMSGFVAAAEEYTEEYLAKNPDYKATYDAIKALVK